MRYLLLVIVFLVQSCNQDKLNEVVYKPEMLFGDYKKSNIKTYDMGHGQTLTLDTSSKEKKKTS